MGFFLTDALESAFTPRGTNARRGQEARQTDVAGIAGEIAGSAGKNYRDALNFTQRFDPQMQSALTALARSVNGSGLRDSAVAAGNTARAKAMSQQVPMNMANNPALAQAYQMANLNKAQDATNQSIFASYDPQKRNQMLLMLLQALQAYKGNSANDFTRSAGIVYGQPQVQVQGGLMDALAPFLGNMFGQQSAGGGK